MYCITKWCAAITDSGKDEYTGRKQHLVLREIEKHDHCPELFRFRLLDDDGVVYAYGLSDDDSSFAPLDKYGPAYGCTEIQYRNENTKTYETL